MILTRLVTNCVRQARGCAYHGWRSGWDHWLQFWLIPRNMILDLVFSTFYTLKKSMETCIGKDGQFSILSCMTATWIGFYPKINGAPSMQNEK
jgi:uncharacterized protein (DUF608 family)